MKSVASALRERDAADVRAMDFEERLALAFRLGDEDLESFRATHGLDRSTAIRTDGGWLPSWRLPRQFADQEVFNELLTE